MEIFLTLKEFEKGVKVLSKAIRRYQKVKEKGDLAKIEKFLSGQKKELDNITDEYLRSIGERFYETVSTYLKGEKEALRERFGRELKDLLEKEGMAIKGQYPDLKIGILTLEVNFDFNYATLYWGNKLEIIKRRLSLKPPLIVKAVREFYHSLRREEFEAKLFLQGLFSAYKRFLSSANKIEGEKVFLVDLLPELAFQRQGKEFREDPKRRNFREYPRYRFSYDLYQLKRSGLKEINGFTFYLSVATFDQTLEKRKALWVPTNEEGEGTYYSYIAFKAS